MLQDSNGCSTRIKAEAEKQTRARLLCFERGYFDSLIRQTMISYNPSLKRQPMPIHYNNLHRALIRILHKSAAGDTIWLRSHILNGVKNHLFLPVVYRSSNAFRIVFFASDRGSEPSLNVSLEITPLRPSSSIVYRVGML